eukprot:TRINITY_DN19355_c0_g1_i1.p1 TRINITY_DN19355_c0_g1~~TRINITY_DN19355_c0_g1_i1.p1  ORF type:complete len:737 (-),score=118.11 TRINITY_DN19355_c0_g1_i1:300-2510(-)
MADKGTYRELSATEKNVPAEQPLLPPPSKISCWKWVRLVLVWVCCTLAAGLIPGQALFAELFAEAGINGHLCKHEFPCDAQVASLNMMLGMGMIIIGLCALPIGLIFDTYGGQTVGTLGAFIVAIGLSLESVAVFSAYNGTDSQTNWLVPVAAVVTDMGSTLNSYCFFGLVWHYPGSTTVILSLSTATYQVSALLPMIMKAAMDRFAINLGQAMLGFAGTVLLSSILTYHVTPSQQEYYDRANEVLGMPLPKPKKKLDICKKLSAGKTAVMLDIRDHSWLCLGFTFSLAFAGFYNSMSSAYGRHLFHSKEAGEHLANMQVVTTAAVGAACAPFIAKIADVLGLQLFAWLLTIFVAIPVSLFLIPSWWAAWATTAGLCLFSTLNQLFMSRYFLHYAPPNRLGVYSGVFTILVMMIMLPFSAGGYVWIMQSPKDTRYIVPFLTMGVLGLIFLVAFNIRFCRVHDGRGVPKLPNMLPEDEMELVMPFGAMTLQEAADIVGLDKDDLFKRLADPDPETLKHLLSLVNIDKVEQVLASHSPDDMIAMLEAQPEVEDEDDEPSNGNESKQASGGAAEIELPVAGGTTKDADKTVDGDQNGNGTPAQQLARSLCGLFREADAARRKEVLEGSGKEADDTLRWRALGECMDTLVHEGDAAALKLFLLEVPIDDQWESMIGMEEWMEQKRYKDMEKKFNKLIPGKAFAGLMKQNPKLKDLVSRMMKREVQRTKARFLGKGKKESK